MVLVRRRSDGLFFTNNNGRRSFSRQGNPENWVSDPSKCKPYANEAGARWSFYTYIPRPANCPHFKMELFRYNNKEYKVHAKECACIKANRKAAKAKFDSKYEIVPVKVQI